MSGSYRNEDPVREERMEYERTKEERRELINRIGRTESGHEFLIRTGAFGPAKQDRKAAER